ncbi:hypothetical protein HPB50_020451 [Hyalomma asiaticum]|uniref:Uncharacterized protein n=1 Tax=Hyalomma asiaticum TaxID=266040 RepID=A0ACB7S100_HYAAI|nr:hypothetical protein HPB50_020451 [Hyalomma asiaticum]
MDRRCCSGSWIAWFALAIAFGGRADGLARFAHRRSDAMDIALRQINLSLLYTLACDTTVGSDVQVKRFQCLLNNIDPADKMVVLGCQYNVGGTMDAATFLTALCENKLPCTKSKNMRPQKPPALPEAENPIQAGVSGPEQAGIVVPQESTSTAAPSTSAPTAGPPEEASTASVATAPPSTSPAPAQEGADPPPVKPGDDEGSREDEPSIPVVSTEEPKPPTEPPPAPADVVQPPPDDPLPPPQEEAPGGDEMSFYPCLCARKAKYRGLLWKPRMNSRRTRAITWKDYNFIFPLSVVRTRVPAPAAAECGGAARPSAGSKRRVRERRDAGGGGCCGGGGLGLFGHDELSEARMRQSKAGGGLPEAGS